MLQLFPQLSEDLTRRILCDGRRIAQDEPALLDAAVALEGLGLVRLEQRRHVLCVNPNDPDYPDVWDSPCDGSALLDCETQLICARCGRTVEYPALNKEVFATLFVELDRSGIRVFLERLFGTLDMVANVAWGSDNDLCLTLADGHSLLIPLVMDDDLPSEALNGERLPRFPLVVSPLSSPGQGPDTGALDLPKLLANDRLWLVNRLTLAVATRCTAFISYAHEDAGFVDSLVEDLKRAGVAVWLDRWELRVGDSLAQRIPAAIRESDYLIVVLSPASARSRWVQAEIDAALLRRLGQDQVTLLPVLYQDCAIPPPLQGIHYADCRGDSYKRGVDTLLQTLQQCTPAAGVTARESVARLDSGGTMDHRLNANIDGGGCVCPLDGRTYRRLTVALLQAFPGKFSLAQMLRYRLDRNLDAIAMGDNLNEIVFRLVGVADSEGWLPHLVNAAREANPGNAALADVAQTLGLTAVDLARPELERFIRHTNSFLDINLWRENLTKMEGRVCRVEIELGAARSFGTGFLVGPDLVMTNYHVIEPLMQKGAARSRALPERVKLRFDYKRLADQMVINPGVVYRLVAHDWLVDSAPPPGHWERPGADELDYALLRVADELGLSPAGGRADPGAEPRGWIDLPEDRLAFEPGSPLIIVQHPQGGALKLAIDTDAIIGLNEGGTMLRYRTNTLPGSSGSPCFDVNWQLVALHHSGDPQSPNPRFNAGTPMDNIVSRLRARGLLERTMLMAW